jgi:hypothetical protein
VSKDGVKICSLYYRADNSFVLDLLSQPKPHLLSQPKPQCVVDSKLTAAESDCLLMGRLLGYLQPHTNMLELSVAIGWMADASLLLFTESIVTTVVSDQMIQDKLTGLCKALPKHKITVVRKSLLVKCSGCGLNKMPTVYLQIDGKAKIPFCSHSCITDQLAKLCS